MKARYPTPRTLTQPSPCVQTGDIIYTCSETWFTHLDMHWRTGMCRLRSDE